MTNRDTNKTRERVVEQTRDGSFTLYSNQFESHYHSIYGARTESEHVFIHHGLKEVIAQGGDSFHIFEMGYGTALNALLTYQFVRNLPITVYYTACDLYPLTTQEFALMDYTSLHLPQDDILPFQDYVPNKWKSLSSQFNLNIRHQDINALSLEPESIDLIYYDAFGPNTQPELWTPSLFMQLHSWLKPEGIFTTYCAKGQVKRDLRTVGFTIESLPGPPGKREMTRGKKI